MTNNNINKKQENKTLILPVVVSGLFASAIIALSMTPTLSALVASIQNTVNTAGTGSLSMKETNQDGSVVCNSTDNANNGVNGATCATINKYGGNLAMIPGQAVSTQINITNTGTVDATNFALTAGACTQSNNGVLNGSAKDLCAKYNITIMSGANEIYKGTAAALNGHINLLDKGITAVKPGATVPFTITAQLDASANNDYQGLQISQPLSWTFGA